jgi:hypothetical protein
MGDFLNSVLNFNLTAMGQIALADEIGRTRSCRRACCQS